MVKKSDLDLVANYVSSGTAVLILGPNFCCGSRTVTDDSVPDYFLFAQDCCKNFGLEAKDFSSDQEIVKRLIPYGPVPQNLDDRRIMAC